MARDFATGFYKSKAWKQCREAYAKQARYLCENCLSQGIHRPGVIVHHVTELTPENIEVPEVALSFDNLQLLCRDCHAEIHSNKMSGRRFIIAENGEVIAR